MGVDIRRYDMEGVTMSVSKQNRRLLSLKVLYSASSINLSSWAIWAGIFTLELFRHPD